jgi:hypothetical protein
VASNLTSRLRIRKLTVLLCVATVTALTALSTASCSSPTTPESATHETATHETATTQPATPKASNTRSVPIDSCETKPSASNTGPNGRLRDNSTTVLKNGQLLENARVKGLEIRGKGVTVRNVKVTGSIFITGDNATLDHVSATGIAISSASGAQVQYSNIAKSPEDGIHITSDSGRMVKNVVLSHNFIHTPKVPNSAHYDGTQVRGVRGLVISCSTYDPGKYRYPYNAAIYLEDANGGNRNVSIEHNWLYGFGFSVMIDDSKTRIIGNRVGGDIHWATCDLGDSVRVSSLKMRDNINDETGKPEQMCSEASKR